MIFVVEDEPVLLRSLVEFLSQAGHLVEGFADAEAAAAAAKASAPDVLVTDLQLPGKDGLALVAELGGLDPGMVRILMTAHASVQTAVQAMRQGCYEYLEKPLDLHKLARLIERALTARRAGRELDWLRERREGPALEALVGASPPMVALRGQVEQLTMLGGRLPPILITGETGVGKGLLARTLHTACKGARAPWIEVNCAAIPENLIEGELFGFEKSAFTDAKQSKPGLFEVASGGTLFLDEIGDLAQAAQAKLLKVVESSAVRRLGAVRDRPTEVTVIAAANIDLEAAVAAGRFRADLYHRLAAFRLVVPPLRERGDDVLALARLFLVEATGRYRKTVAALGAETETVLLATRWPGNVRELRFAIERAVILAPPGATELSPAGLAPERATSEPTQPSVRVRVGVGRGRLEVHLPEEGVSFEELERAVLHAALEQAGGNIVRAGKFLHLTRDVMRYRIKKHGLSGGGPADPKSG